MSRPISARRNSRRSRSFSATSHRPRPPHRPEAAGKPIERATSAGSDQQLPQPSPPLQSSNRFQTNRIPLELLRKHTLRRNRLNQLLTHLSSLRWGIMPRPNGVRKNRAIAGSNIRPSAMSNVLPSTLGREWLINVDCCWVNACNEIR